MNKFKRTSGFLPVLLIVILSIPGMSENNNIIPHAAAATTSTLTVTTQDMVGNIKTGFSMILKQAGTTVATGFTPVSFTLNNTLQYTLTARGFGSYVFDHWLDTGSAVNPRTVSISTNTQITAVYRIVTISLNPSSGPTGTTVTVTGKNFAANSAVTISYDGSAITTTPTTITTDSTGSFTGSITVPASSTAGLHTVKATDAASNSALAQFTVTTPSISLSPSSGPAGTTVNISGSNFVANSAISITYDNNPIATTPTPITTTSTGSFTASITVPSPSNPGSHTVNATDASSNSASAQFTVTTPSISLSPSSGPAGTTVNISGSNFVANSAISITYDNNPIATTPTLITTTSTGSFTASITVPSPSNPGSHTVNATDASSNSALAQFTVTTTTTSKLTITTQDSVGNTKTGYYVALQRSGNTIATGFSPVTFTVNNNLLYSVAPDSGFGAYAFDHWLDTGYPNNPRFVSIGIDTQLTAVYRTTAISLSPSTGPAGTTVTVTGNTFSANSAITISFDGTRVSTNPTTITTSSTGTFTATFTVPTSSLAGSHLVRVSDASGSHTYWGSFIVGPSAAISLSPTSANVGSAVKVTGTNFSPYSRVGIYFDATLLSDIRVGNSAGDPSVNPALVETNSAGGFVADIEIPYATAGPHNVKATDQSNSNTKTFTVTPGSLLFNPTSGHVGTIVNLHASGFAANSHVTVTFDGTPVTTNPGTITTSAEGEFPGSFTVPTTAGIGIRTVLISDNSGNTFSSTFTVTDPSTPMFNVQNIITGLTGSDGIAFIPDNGPGTDGSGNFMVIEKSGTVIVVKNNGGTFVKQSAPFVTVPTVQGYAEDAGLLGIAFDPNWVTTKMVYFYITVSVGGALQNQVVRYIATTNSGNIVANNTIGQKLIIGGILAGSSHNGGHLKFDSQGHLYIATGDSHRYGTIAQDITSLAGKMLKITPLANPGSNGLLYSIPSTNPFVTNPDPTIKKEIFSYGLRNPFNFDIDSQTGKIYVNNIGENTWETVLDSTTPANFGWTPYEGPTIGNPQNLANYREPVYWYPHGGIEPSTGFTNGLEAITGGAFYHYAGTYYPSQLQGAYFFGDYAIGYIVALLPTNVNPPVIDPATGVPKAQVQTIMSGLSFAPIDMAVWNGKLYYVDLNGNVAVLNYN